MHEVGLLITLTMSLVVALVLGTLAQRLRLSPIIGYVAAGIALGPHTPGFVGDQRSAAQLAEVGVILLMFGVGLHFHLKDLVAVRAIAIPGAVGQSLVATVLGVLLARAAGWGLGAGLVLGMGIAVASTVVLTRGLVENNLLETAAGRAAVGWLVVEDIFTVLVLVLIPLLAGALQGNAEVKQVLAALGWATLKLAALGASLLVIGSRLIPWILLQVARTRSRELFTLSVLAIALAIATGSDHFFGASLALGAFLAGMIVGHSEVSHQAAADALPMRDAFSVLFFVSVGMMFDPDFVLREPWLVLGTLAIILLAKPLAAVGIVALLGYSPRTAITVALGLAQIGEFTFILANVAGQQGLLPEEGRGLLVAGGLISIGLNPLLFRQLGTIEAWIRRRPRLWALLNRRAEARGQAVNRATRSALEAEPAGVQAVVVGYGPVGQTLARILRDFDIRPVIVDLNVDTTARLSAQGAPAIYGDASRPEVLRAAGIGKARFLLVTLPDLPGRVPVIVAARSLNPAIKVLARARYLNERPALEDLRVTAVSYEEAEAAVGLAEILLREVGADESRIAMEGRKIRGELALRPAGAGLDSASSARPID